MSKLATTNTTTHRINTGSWRAHNRSLTKGGSWQTSQTACGWSPQGEGGQMWGALGFEVQAPVRALKWVLR